MPKLLAMVLETKDRMIGAAAFGMGIVTQARPLLFSVEGQHHRIQVKFQRTSGLGQGKEFAAQLVMQPHDLPNGIGGQALEKPTDRGFVGQCLQSEQRKKEAIVLQFVGFVEPLDPGDEQKQAHQHQIDRIEVRPVRSRPQEPLQTTAQIQLVTKPLDQEESAMVRQEIRFE